MKMKSQGVQDEDEVRIMNVGENGMSVCGGNRADESVRGSRVE